MDSIFIVIIILLVVLVLLAVLGGLGYLVFHFFIKRQFFIKEHSVGKDSQQITKNRQEVEQEVQGVENGGSIHAANVSASTTLPSELLNEPFNPPSPSSSKWPRQVSGQPEHPSDVESASLSSSSNSSPSSTEKEHTVLSGNRINIKAAIIFGLVLILAIPLMLVREVVDEREGLYRGVLSDIAGSWGEQQVISGPLLAVPYWVRVMNVSEENGKRHVSERLVEKVAFFLPDTFDFSAKLAPEHRYRGIYEALVYNADIAVTAAFSPVAIDGDNIAKIAWDKALLLFAVTDVSAIESVSLVLNNKQQAVEPGGESYLSQGFHSPLDLTGSSLIASEPDDAGSGAAEAEELLVNLSLKVRGSDLLKIAPVGNTSKVSVAGAWPHPSFIGNILPAAREMDNQQFSAQWEVPKIARGYPQAWTGSNEVDANRTLQQTLVGVSLSEPVHLYSIVGRAVKYGILFIGLTFMTLLIFELTVGKPLHLIQYGLVGLSLTLFYLTLLSLAEHMAFMAAYFIASAVAITMIGAYVWAILKSVRPTVVVMSVLAGLYGVLYSILHMEDFALLMGTILLIVVTCGLMYATRNLTRV